VNALKRILDRTLLTIAALACLAAQSANAQDAIQFIETVSEPASPPPVSDTFFVSTAGDYTVTISDFGVPGTAVPPADNIYLMLADPDANSIVANLSGDGTFNVTLAEGSYLATLIAAPDATSPRASVGVSVELASNGNVAYESVAAFDASEPLDNPTAIELDFEAPAAGEYSFRVLDRGFPDGLATLNSIFIRGGVPLGTLDESGSIALLLDEGDDVGITVVATRSSASDRSLVTVDVSDATGVLLATTEQIGDWTEVVQEFVAVPEAGEWTLTVTDFSLPAALDGLRSIVLQTEPAATTPLPGSGSIAFDALPGEAVLLSAADSGAVGTAGYLLGPTDGLPAVETVLAFEPETPIDDSFAAINGEFELTMAQTVTLSVVDFQFPAQFNTVTALLIGPDGVAETLDAPGTVAVPLNPGNYSVAAIGQLPAGGSGLLGVSVSDSAELSLFEAFAAGGAIRSVEVTNEAENLLGLSLTDFRFPAAFQSLSVAVTRGTQLIGTSFGGGEFTFDAGTGEYALHIVALPDPGIGYSTYAAAIGPAPRPPELTFSSSAASVPSGDSVTLTWDTNFSTTCVASDGWTGDKGSAGSEAIGDLTAETLFTLTCSGDGGSISSSVTVAVTPAQRINGGGTSSPLLLVAGSVAALLVRRRRRIG